MRLRRPSKSSRRVSTRLIDPWPIELSFANFAHLQTTWAIFRHQPAVVFLNRALGNVAEALRAQDIKFRVAANETYPFVLTLIIATEEKSYKDFTPARWIAHIKHVYKVAKGLMRMFGNIVGGSMGPQMWLNVPDAVDGALVDIIPTYMEIMEDEGRMYMKLAELRAKIAAMKSEGGEDAELERLESAQRECEGTIRLAVGKLVQLHRDGMKKIEG